MEKFNVQPYVSSGHLETTPYSRRDYYKIWLLIGKSILHYADRSIEIDQPGFCISDLF